MYRTRITENKREISSGKKSIHTYLSTLPYNYSFQIIRHMFRITLYEDGSKITPPHFVQALLRGNLRKRIRTGDCEEAN